MSDLRGNMIIGATLAAFLGVLGLRTGADAVYETHYPEKSAFAIDLPDAPAAGEAADAAPKPIDWGTVLADPANLAALVTKGEQLHKACVTCHTFEPGGANGTGPNLYGVVGRVSGTHPGFAYSDPMKAHAKPWTYDELAAFIAAPASYIRGTKMSFAGYRRQDDQVALVAYLRAQAASPAPLPAPLPAEAPAEAPAAGADPATPPAEGAAAPEAEKK
jgi:cytochrome c